MNQVDVVGWTTTVLISVLNMPQAWKACRERDVSGLSPLTLAIHLLTGCLFLYYGVLLNQLPIIVANAIYVATTLVVVVAYRCFSSNRT